MKVKSLTNGKKSDFILVAFMKCSGCLLELRMAAMVVRVRGTR